MNKKASTYIIIIAAIVFAIIHLMRLNYEDLSWQTNNTPYTGILIAIVILIVAGFRLRK